MAIINYIDAISKAMWEEMERDENVFLIGEDVGNYGGAFKVTKGFQKHFGSNRVIDSVLAESAIIGAATGAAVAGMRPIVEMQFSDFVTNGFSQLVNNTASISYRWNLSCPIVLRMPTGAGVRGGPFHSRNTEAWFFHQPGLKIVAPSTPYDAKGLMKSAIRDDNPVLYLEHKRFYRNIKGEVPDEEYLIEIGVGEIKKSGSDISLITYGGTLHQSIEAAEKIEKENGISVEVVDLRTLAPLDKNIILTSVKKTGKVLIVHEDNLTGGIGAEIAAIISENAFNYLDSPIKRVAAFDIPTPYSPTLEDYFLPNTNKIYSALIELSKY